MGAAGSGGYAESGHRRVAGWRSGVVRQPGDSGQDSQARARCRSLRAHVRWTVKTVCSRGLRDRSETSVPYLPVQTSHVHPPPSPCSRYNSRFRRRSSCCSFSPVSARRPPPTAKPRPRHRTIRKDLCAPPPLGERGVVLWPRAGGRDVARPSASPPQAGRHWQGAALQSVWPRPSAHRTCQPVRASRQPVLSRR